MTTIAWDGKTLAADRQVTFHNSTADGEIMKIARAPDGSLTGSCGDLYSAGAWLRWFESGLGDRPPVADDFSALIVRRNGTLELHRQAGWVQLHAPRFTMGSGADYATGAMVMGADAVRAVHVAAMFDIGTGDTVDALELRPA